MLLTIVRADEATINPSQDSGVTSHKQILIEKIAEETKPTEHGKSVTYNLLKIEIY